jgi:hypothetical protein
MHLRPRFRSDVIQVWQRTLGLRRNLGRRRDVLGKLADRNVEPGFERGGERIPFVSRLLFRRHDDSLSMPIEADINSENWYGNQCLGGASPTAVRARHA